MADAKGGPSVFITAALHAKPDTGCRIYANADGLGPEAHLRVALLDEYERPIPGFSGENAAVVRTSGFQTPVLWAKQRRPGELPERFRIKVTFEGAQRDKIRLSALYIAEDASAVNDAVR